MKKLKKDGKITFISNLILICVLSLVTLISFSSEKIIPIYGGEDVSAIYYGNKENPNVSLMFNVYENKEVVNGILDVLKKYNVKSTFFLGGCFIDDNEQLLIRIKNEGHEIANHGYFHKDHKKLDYEGNRKEIVNNEEIIYSLCGVKTNLFAPPSGSFSEKTLDLCYDLGYKVIMWSKDTIDWRDNDEDLVYKRATKNISGGDLILMHPKIHTLNVLPRIIEYYKSVGLNIVTVSENIKE